MTHDRTGSGAGHCSRLKRCLGERFNRLGVQLGDHPNRVDEHAQHASKRPQANCCNEEDRKDHCVDPPATVGKTPDQPRCERTGRHISRCEHRQRRRYDGRSKRSDGGNCHRFATASSSDRLGGQAVAAHFRSRGKPSINLPGSTFAIQAQPTTKANATSTDAARISPARDRQENSCSA
jgi:hypothetical protein